MTQDSDIVACQWCGASVRWLWTSPTSRHRVAVEADQVVPTDTVYDAARHQLHAVDTLAQCVSEYTPRSRITTSFNALPRGLRRLINALRLMVFNVLLPLLSGILGFVTVWVEKDDEYGPMVAGFILVGIALALSVICLRWAGRQ